jgi:hypothetical protein
MTTLILSESDLQEDEAAELSDQERTTDQKNFDVNFDLVKSSGDRSRGILYFYCVIVVCSLIYYYEDKLDSPGNRYAIMSAANACIQEKLDGDKTVPLDGFVEDIKKNETGGFFGLNFDDPKKDRKLCKFYYNYVRDNYLIIPLDTKQNPSDAFTAKYKSILQASADDDVTSVPILNIKIDRNLSLIFQNFVSIFVLLILLASLNAERRCLHAIVGLLANNRWRKRAVLNCHVFSRGIFGQAWCIFLFLPVFQAFKIVDDFEGRGFMYDQSSVLQTNILLFVEMLSGMVLFACALSCFLVTRKLNRKLLAISLHT